MAQLRFTFQHLGRKRTFTNARRVSANDTQHAIQTLWREARIGLGGLAYRPWRAREAEALLRGKRLDEAAAEAAAKAAMAGALTHGANGFKPELGRRTLVRALLQAQAMES